MLLLAPPSFEMNDIEWTQDHDITSLTKSRIEKEKGRITMPYYHFPRLLEYLVLDASVLLLLLPEDPRRGCTVRGLYIQ
jgi:hypothetical protein